MALKKEIRKFLTFFRSLTRLSARSLYHNVLRASNDIKPQVTIKNTDHGIFCGFSNDYLFKQAIENGSNEPHFHSLVNEMLLPSNIVLDIGGNIGTHSIALSKIVNEGHVYTFEPQSLVFSILQNNLLLNSCHNVTSYRFAVSDQDHLTVSMEPFSFGGEQINNGALRVDLNGSLGDFALTRTLDSFNFKKVDFMKIDIQGSELRALNGSKELISKHRPYIFIEIEEQHLRALATCTKELIETLFSMNYALYRIETNYPCDHICVPIEKVEEFESTILQKVTFKTSQRIYGKTVEVVFKKDSDQNYFKLDVS